VTQQGREGLFILACGVLCATVIVLGVCLHLAIMRYVAREAFSEVCPVEANSRALPR
jgi:hypothetical protein